MVRRVEAACLPARWAGTVCLLAHRDVTERQAIRFHHAAAEAGDRPRRPLPLRRQQSRFRRLDAEAKQHDDSTPSEDIVGLSAVAGLQVAVVSRAGGRGRL